MGKLLRIFGAGALFALGVLSVAASVPPVYSAALAVLTGPSGTNPVSDASKASVGDFNAVIAGVNANAAWAGTGQPLAIVGAQLTTTGKIFNSTVSLAALSLIQFINAITTTTGTAGAGGNCNASGATECLGVVDTAGVVRFIPLY